MEHQETEGSQQNPLKPRVFRVPKPPQNRPLTIRPFQRDKGRLGERSKRLRPNSRRTDPEVAFKDDFDAVLPEESKNQQKKSQNQTNISAAENVALHFLHRSAQNLDMAEYDMDTFGEFDGKHDIPSASFPNKWIIGPFFQSLKSKISSFTEIVMSPVKVFKANSSPPPSADLHEDKQAFGTAQAQGQSGTEDTEAMEGCKKLSMDLSAHGSGRADECPETEQTLPDFAPLRRSPSSFGDPVEVLQSLGPVFTSSIPLCPSVVAVGASQESNIKMPGAEELKGKRAGQAKPRKDESNFFFLCHPQVMHKNEERGKVSSIRIRKTLPKPPNNLTPMGLPKTVRVKKKDFSLEEIYTNKNFKKPPESRLETIFEVPTSRRNGSVSSFGQKRMKRFLEFSEVGQVRKPKKPLAGVAKAGASTSRTRRGGPKDAAALSAQDVDLLLCTKLDQLNLWLIHDQSDESMPLQQSFGSL
ncbi:hypothetical protein fugu_015212 [Takifugu bimaculatus]|uniref:Tantalus-like domain-containing protein n=1 Tax=Takifugu bimaculatus TaxID=433685 RepID=A0A4Z2BZT1_9TELE|nr:hypothetical protein fugu_015212 [Takifugu bimaculatus]